MQVLVTGSDGYIGSGLVRKLLAEGHGVHCVDKCVVYDLDAEKLPITRPCDEIKDVTTQQLKNIDHIIHLAAISNDPSA
jgi:nucleoside-diphosphate-sugar epimerase